MEVDEVRQLKEYLKLRIDAANKDTLMQIAEYFKIEYAPTYINSENQEFQEEEIFYKNEEVFDPANPTGILNELLEKAIKQVAEGKTYTTDEVLSRIKAKYGFQ